MPRPALALSVAVQSTDLCIDRSAVTVRLLTDYSNESCQSRSIAS